MEDILEALYLNFFSLYNSCYAKHPNAYISQEIRFMKLLVNDITGLEEIALSTDVNSSLLKVQNLNDSEFIIANLQTDNIHEEAFKKKKQTSKKNSNKALSANVSSITIPANANQTSNSVYSPKSNILLEQGTIFNDLLLCKEAVLILTKAIQSNPSNREAYIERALAYFETNQLSLALQDYESAKKLTVVAPFKYASHNLMAMSAIYIPENKIDFSKGLIAGTLSGASVSVVEFIPSTYSSCRGILNGLWAFVCSPNEVSQEMLNAAYGIGEFISNHSTEECFQCVVPELKELSLYWENINDYSRGEKIGYLIGKYGIDIFAPIGILKGVNKVKALKRANTMCTLEACASSKVKQIKIIEESTKRALTRTTLIETAKKGKILVKNSNVQYHIMQKKHAWEKVLNLVEILKKISKK